MKPTISPKKPYYQTALETTLIKVYNLDTLAELYGPSGCDFGTNIYLPVKEFLNWLHKLAKLGAKDIQILDCETISFIVPKKNQVSIYLFLITQSCHTQATFNEKNRKMQLTWDT